MESLGQTMGFDLCAQRVIFASMYFTEGIGGDISPVYRL